MIKWKECKTLFWAFFKIGAFTFGGGYAMVPLIEREAVETHHWITDQDMLNILAISESTPGPISINSATFIGYRVAGVWGSAAATLGTVLPSFLVISVLSLFIMAVSYTHLGGQGHQEKKDGPQRAQPLPGAASAADGEVFPGKQGGLHGGIPS